MYQGIAEDYKGRKLIARILHRRDVCPRILQWTEADRQVTAERRETDRKNTAEERSLLEGDCRGEKLIRRRLQRREAYIHEVFVLVTDSAVHMFCVHH